MIKTAASGVRKVTLQAEIIRADGTREPLGQIAEWHKNPIIRAWYALKRLVKRN
jgi:hypothetical protein